MRTNWVMYFHHETFPQAPEMQKFRCTCGRVIFEANTKNIVMMNDIGVPLEIYAPGQHVIKVQCHSCKSKYSILYQ